MSHNIEHYDYKENVDKKMVQADLNTHVKHATWHEGGHGIEPIRWNDIVCKNYDEAVKWIEAHDKGWYDQLAVKYYEPVHGEKSKKIDELDAKIQEAYKIYRERSSVVYPKTRTSEFIGCNNCKSRLSSKHLNRNHCPVCNADLRPETMLKSIAAAETKWKKAVENKKEYIETHSKKAIRWLVKIEYHT